MQGDNVCHPGVPCQPQRVMSAGLCLQWCWVMVAWLGRVPIKKAGQAIHMHQGGGSSCPGAIVQVHWVPTSSLCVLFQFPVVEPCMPVWLRVLRRTLRSSKLSSSSISAERNAQLSSIQQQLAAPLPGTSQPSFWGSHTKRQVTIHIHTHAHSPFHTLAHSCSHPLSGLAHHYVDSFSIFSLKSLVKGISISYHFKEPALDIIDLCIVFWRLYFLYLKSDLYFILSSADIGLCCCSFSSSFRCWLRLFV